MSDAGDFSTTGKTVNRRAASPRRPDREGKRMVYGYFEAEEFRDLKVLLARRDVTTNAGVAKGIALLFEHFGEKVPRSLARRLKILGL